MQIDLNCDLGEGFGAYTIGNDAAMMPYITSANIACGFHAGDATVMQQTVALCVQHNVAIGAHPSFPDLQGFGRRNMSLSATEVYNIVVYQVGALSAFVKVAGSTLHHVKPHGALYNMAAKDKALAAAIVQAVKDVDASLLLYGLAGSELIKAAAEAGLRSCSEIFADRTYQADGTLTPRTQPDAFIHDAAAAVQQVTKLLQQKMILAETVCIHGDGPNAVAFANTLYHHLQAQGVQLKTPSHS
jgi:UPF0271 protein